MHLKALQYKVYIQSSISPLGIVKKTKVFWKWIYLYFETLKSYQITGEQRAHHPKGYRTRTASAAYLHIFRRSSSSFYICNKIRTRNVSQSLSLHTHTDAILCIENTNRNRFDILSRIL